MSRTERSLAPLEQLLEWAAAAASEEETAPATSLRVQPWGPNAGEDDAAYGAWWTWQAEREAPPEPMTGVGFHVVLSVGTDPLPRIKSCINSLRRQSYGRFEAVFVTPQSVERRRARLVGRLVRSDPRFRWGDVNEDLGQAADPPAPDTRTFVTFLGTSDVLHRHSLQWLAAAAEDGVDMVFSDEDELGDDGQHRRPVFKPGWSAEILLAQPYLGDLVAISADLLKGVTLLDAGDRYDLLLRATEEARRIVHVPRVLYHRGSPAPEVPGAADTLARALERRGITGSVEPADAPRSWRIRRRWHSASVRIVIPFRDQAPLVAACVSSIQAHDCGADLEIVLVDNGSIEPETGALWERLAADDPRVRVIHEPGPFNWSALNNTGAASAETDFVLFLNNDIEVVDDEWLPALLEQAVRREVGAVGARLLYPDGTLQHAGIVVGAGVIGWHIFMGLPAGDTGYLGWDRIVRPYSAVTGACLLSRRDVFEAVGGFDESLEVAFNDVDYCLRVRDLGLEVLYTPHCTLVHDEAVTRGLAGYRPDGARFLAKWGRERIRTDPFYNPNLSRFNAWCPVRGPGEDALWEQYVDELAAPPS